MEKILSVQELAEFLEHLLSQKPSETGRRVCSERALALKLQVDRMKIQKAFDLLVEGGILARRHGSGTYVRKVPKASATPSMEGWKELLLRTEDLFAKPSSAPVRRQINEEHRTLKLALLPTWESESNHSILDGIKDRVKSEGHLVKTYKIKQDVKEDVPPHTIPPDPKLVAKLKTEHFDGYILWARYVPVMEMAFPGETPPCVYIGSGNRDDDLNSAPLVRIDLEDATVRGLRLLAKEGYKRIGMVRYSSMSRDTASDEQLYHETLDKLGLTYRNIESCRLKDQQAEEVTKRMFSNGEPPEAIFVDDDILLRHLVKAWSKENIIPGENLAVIIISGKGNPLPDKWNWSCMEFHPLQVGRMAVDCLLREIQTAGEELCSFEHLSVWRPGTTHLLKNRI